MFICTIAPLLPVSIVETPSIMTVVDWTIEPSRWACTPFMTTPGASCAELQEAAVRDRQVLDGLASES